MIYRCCDLEGRSGHDAAWQLLARLYREVTGEDTLPEIVFGPRGKPDFAHGPWHFSLSHTRLHAFAALAECPVGIDAEERNRVVSPRLAERILSPGERAEYDVAQDRNLALLCFWVLKEAAAKCSGEGIQGFPNKTAFSLADPRLIVTETAVIAVCEARRAGDQWSPLHTVF